MVSERAQVKFRTEYICLRCGHPREWNERTCRKCGGPIGERVVKRVALTAVGQNT